MVPGLMGGKMSSSDPDSKIDFLDSPEVIKRKIKKAFCEEGNVTDNGLLAFLNAVLIPISQLRLQRLRSQTRESTEEGSEATGSQKPFVSNDAPEGTVFTITREKGEGSSHYRTYQELEDDFAAKKIHPGDLKASVREAITNLLEPIRAAFLASEEWKKIEQLAYPDPNAKPEPKKKKKVCRILVDMIQMMLKLVSSRKRSTILPHPARERMPDRQYQTETCHYLPQK